MAQAHAVTSIQGTATHLAGPGDFIALMKPRVMSLVVFTTVVGMLMAPTMPHPLLMVIAIIAIAAGLFAHDLSISYEPSYTYSAGPVIKTGAPSPDHSTSSLPPRRFTSTGLLIKP